MTDKGKRVGLFDYRLGNFHSDTFLRVITQDMKDRGYTVGGCMGVRKKDSRAWAEERAIPYCDSADELNERCDFFMVLAPSNPEAHYEMCRQVLPFGKPTYVDKTFAPDLATAKRIFALADKHGAPIQTSSVCRYSNLQERVREIGRARLKHMSIWQPGRSFEEYAIHPVEAVVACMGLRAERIMRVGVGKYSQLFIGFSGGRTATINIFAKTKTPQMATITTPKHTENIVVDRQRIFPELASHVFDMFESGRPNIDRRETLLVRRILDAAMDKKALGRFVALATA